LLSSKQKQIEQLSEYAVFVTCTLCLLPALICQIQLVSLTVESSDAVKKASASESAPEDVPLTSLDGSDDVEN
jgi:hypothetical protein